MAFTANSSSTRTTPTTWWSNCNAQFGKPAQPATEWALRGLRREHRARRRPPGHTLISGFELKGTDVLVVGIVASRAHSALRERRANVQRGHRRVCRIATLG